LHRNRRLEDLAGPVLAQTLADAAIEPQRVELLALGNTSAGGNPARLIGLVAGLADRTTTTTIDRHTASGLEAIVWAYRSVECGDVEIAVAGGAEALSTAPWRISKPRTLQHMPRFMGFAQTDDRSGGDFAAVEAAEALAIRLGIPRSQQDEAALACHIRSTLAREGRRLTREIVALKAKAEEGRDELVDDLDIEDLEAIPSILGDGTVTTGNSAVPADGAAFVVIVSDRVYQQLGCPPALRLDALASIGVAPAAEVEAPVAAARALVEATPGLSIAELQAVELGEASAVQAIAFRSALGLGEGRLNADGGQLSRGQPIGAASAVLVVRLFSRLIRAETVSRGARGAAIIGAAGGQAIAALFSRG
jgi:acetyl-CoA C-acetyltransferase